MELITILFWQCLKNGKIMRLPFALNFNVNDYKMEEKKKI